MTQYVKTDGGSTIIEWPYSATKLKRDAYPSSVPRRPTLAQLAEFNVYPVVVNNTPTYNVNTEVAELNPTPSYTGATWELGWTVRPLTNDELVGRAKSVFESTVEQAGSQYSEADKLFLLAAYLEVKMVRLGVLLGGSAGGIDTPMVDAINAVFPGQTKLQIGTTIENRVQPFLVTGATALANKIKDGA